MVERTFTDQHGIEVFFRAWPVEDARAAVVIAHGASEHSGRYGRFAAALNDARCAVYAIDHRGHGVTSEQTGVGRMGPPGGRAVIDDLHELMGIAGAEHVGRPVVVFGHSLGSIITLGYLVAHPGEPDLAVLSGFAASVDPVQAAGMRDLFRSMVDAGQGDADVDVLGGLNAPFEPARTPFDWLSRDEAEVDAYVADRWCGDNHPLTYGYFAAIFDAAGEAIEPEALGRIECPVLLVAGAEDPAAAMGENPRQLAAALEAVGVEATCRIYEGARHELLNETNRDEVTADVIGWITDRLPG